MTTYLFIYTQTEQHSVILVNRLNIITKALSDSNVEYNTIKKEAVVRGLQNQLNIFFSLFDSN